MTASGHSDVAKQLRYLAAALKAPRITEAAQRLAEQARDAGWTHEDYLTAVLEREVSARNASGAQLRIRAAGFPARKTLEDFNFDAQLMPTERSPTRPPPANSPWVARMESALQLAHGFTASDELHLRQEWSG
jgi:hypothetical protein